MVSIYIIRLVRPHTWSGFRVPEQVFPQIIIVLLFGKVNSLDNIKTQDANQLEGKDALDSRPQVFR